MKGKDKIIWALYLNHRCNLHCDYCFARNLSDDMEVSIPSLFKIIDFAIRYSKKHNKNCELGFFGKEPLLSYKIIERAVGYCADKRYNVTFSINTNGVLLNRKMMDLFNRNNFNIVLSLDRLISKKDDAERFLDFDKKNIKIRTTIDSKNILLIDRIISDFIRSGFLDISIAFDYSDTGFLRIGDDVIYEGILYGLLEYIKQKQKDERITVPLFDRILNYGIKKGEVKFSSYPFCQIGNKIFSVDVDGNIYPCWRFIGNRRMIIGNVFDGRMKKLELNIKINKKLIEEIMPFDYICFWAYLKKGKLLSANIRILNAMKRISDNIQ